ncbi:uncharacterized protein LOC114286266 isoform X15 [Camellia sinensis]|uniref:uncharacterized protein LOC114286266 isoform X15 n=1 Tax=Camellia sinensis TaxID=4442 RepID=UPI001035A487|nr:uncharacterized protein LOC114286266 isoform X15 [Camellia sinensis]
MSLQKLFKPLPSLSIRPQIPNPPLSLLQKLFKTLTLSLSPSPSDPKSKTQTLTRITMSEKEKMDKENTHRQSSEPEEKNKEREVTTEREDGRKETEETNPCKEHFHPSTSHRELLVSIRFNEPGWQWSGCFLPDHLGDTQDGT